MSHPTALGSNQPVQIVQPSARTNLPARGARWSRQVAADIVGLLDAAAVTVGALVPAAIYELQGNAIVDWGLLFRSGVAGAIITYMCLRSWNMYDRSRTHDFPKQPVTLLTALAIGIASVIGLGLPDIIRQGHLWVWFLTWLAASNLLLLLNRTAANMILARLTAEGRFHEHVAVFGAGEIARRVKEHLSNPDLGITLAGVYDDRAGEERLDAAGLDVAGRLADLTEVARAGEIDRIIIALPQSADRRVANVVRKLEHLPASIHVVTHISSDLADSGRTYKVSNMGPIGLLDTKAKPLADWAPFIKRSEDLVVGLLLLLIFLPLFPLIAAAIKLESKGPVFFVQKRRGLNQRVIHMVKFRTMRVLEDGDDVRQAVPGDDRITAVGRILRRTSLDELPQLINVFRGEMSLVGPRPHALVHDEQFGEMLETYANRHQVKPGITGLAQVMGHRGETATPGKVEARVNADIEYIRNWSLGLDLKILANTIAAVVKGENAH